MKSPRTHFRKVESINGYLFALPYILGFLALTAYPVLYSFYLSFTNYSVLKSPQWVGIENYRELLTDDVFHTAIKNTFIYMLTAVPLGTVMAIQLALLLNTKVRGMAFYRTLFFIPSLVPLIATAMLWMWVFNGEYGLLNDGLRRIGVTAPNWMGDPAWAKWTLVIMAVWGTGNAMVIYLAGLQDIPQNLYEAADLDGASPWKKTKAVTLPMLSPVIMFNGIMGMIGGLQQFALPYVMFPGGAPARSTLFVSMYLFDNAFNNQRMGFASAIGWVMFIITLILTLTALKVSDKFVVYDRS